MRAFRFSLALTLLCLTGETALAAQGESFEKLLGRSVEVYDMRGMLLPFVKTCERERTPFRRLFCEALNERLKAQHQSKVYFQSFEVDTGGPLGVRFSPNLAKPEMVIKVKGCLTCTKPMLGRRGGDISKARFFLFREPKSIRVRRGGVFDLAGIDISETKAVMPKKMSAKKFQRDVAPHLRLDLLYRPVAGVTQVGRRHRYGVLTFELLGHRVYDKCSGTVYAAEPKMKGKYKVDRNDMTCPQNLARGKVKKIVLPPKLPEATVRRLMADVSADMHTCYNQFGVTGDYTINMVVMPDGRVKEARSLGDNAETPTAHCVERLVKNVRFPRFSGRRVHVPWPFKIEKK
ncbi:MAG: hypothetical protein JRH20_12260 [Deltaproteobacteria bacterium]|nr:hypothetical protein [Deltaproteobacteria bacterium]